MLVTRVNVESIVFGRLYRLVGRYGGKDLGEGGIIVFFKLESG